MNQIRPRKLPLPNLDRAAYLERFKRATEKHTGQRFQHFATEAEWEAHREGVKKDQDSGLVPF